MLSPLRRPLPHRLCQNISRSYAVEAASTSTSTPTSEHIPLPADSQTAHLRPFLIKQRNQYLYVRIKDANCTSMPAQLSIIRGLERELGRIKDYELYRDSYTTTRFQRRIRIRLEDSTYWDTLPEAGINLKVTVPVVPTETLRRPGGIGISDIQSLLEPQDKVTADAVPSTESVQEGEKEGEEQKDQNEVKSVEVAILRSTNKDSGQATFMISKERRLQIGKNFVRWGGFYSPAPASADSAAEGVEGSEGSESASPQTTRMQKLRERYGGETETSIVDEAKERANAEAAQEIVDGFEKLLADGAVKQQPSGQVVTEIEVQAVEEVTPPQLGSTTSSTSVVQETSTTAPASSVSSSQTPASPASPSTPTPSSPVPFPESSISKRAQRREKLLELARMNAQQPLPETLKQRELEAQKTAEEEAAQKAKDEEKTKNPRAIRERLWRLMGGLLP